MTRPEGAAVLDGDAQRADARSDPRLDWWRDARFGMFIHWGLYAIAAGEWRGERIPGLGEWIMHRARIPAREYERLARRFDPVMFDAREWVGLARDAGQRYLVITAKHHDGFAMFDSAMSDYDVVDATPFGRDPLKELAAECQRQGIRLCFYYSQAQDWHHPGGDGNDWDYQATDEQFDGYLREYVAPQVRELLTGYGPIGLIWFDTPGRMTPEQSRSLGDLVHELQPGCLVSGRIGNNVGDYAVTGDNVIPTEMLEVDWEVPATINDTWGFKHDDERWKSAGDLIHKLVDVVSKNGNYLLNVGPTAGGLIPPPSVERLEQIGRWMDGNGESVYGSKAGPWQGLGWGRTTASRRDPKRAYLHVFEWPRDGRLRLPSLARPVSSATFVAGGVALPVEEGRGGILIRGPTRAPDPVDTVVRLQLAEGLVP